MAFYENNNGLRFNDFVNIFNQVGPMFGLPENFRNNINNLRDFPINNVNLDDIFDVFRNLTRDNNINLKEILLVVLMFTHKEKMFNFINERQRSKEYHNLVSTGKNELRKERKTLLREKELFMLEKKQFMLEKKELQLDKKLFVEECKKKTEHWESIDLKKEATNQSMMLKMNEVDVKLSVLSKKEKGEMDDYVDKEVELENTRLILSSKTEEVALLMQNASCVICMENPKNHLCLPCKHLCMCEKCCNVTSVTKCPICREVISEVVKCFV